MSTPIEVLAPTQAAPAPSAFGEFWYYFRQNRGAVAGLVVIAIIVLLAIFADVVSPHPASEQYRDALLKPPVWEEGGSCRPAGLSKIGWPESRIFHSGQAPAPDSPATTAGWRVWPRKALKPSTEGA